MHEEQYKKPLAPPSPQQPMIIDRNRNKYMLSLGMVRKYHSHDLF